MMRTWSARQIAMLRELYPHMSTREVARRIGRPLGATRSRAKALGLRKSAEYRASGAIRPEREYCYTPEQMLAWLTEHVRLDGECRIWAGRKRRGLPIVQWRHDRWMARRLLWVLSGRDLPHGHMVFDTCGNHACMNIRHLRAGTRDEMYKVAPRRHGAGAGITLAIALADRAKMGIRERGAVASMLAQGMTYTEIGRRYGVTGGAVSQAVARWNRMAGMGAPA